MTSSRKAGQAAYLIWEILNSEAPLNDAVLAFSSFPTTLVDFVPRICQVANCAFISARQSVLVLRGA